MDPNAALTRILTDLETTMPRTRTNYNELPYNPEVYLSHSNGRFRVISNGMPICADTADKGIALQAAKACKLTVAEKMWNGDLCDWAAF